MIISHKLLDMWELTTDQHGVRARSVLAGLCVLIPIQKAFNAFTFQMYSPSAC